MVIDFNSISKNELVRLIGQYTFGKNISWSSYDREKIVETLKTNGYVFSVVSKISRLAANMNIIAGKTVNGSFKENKDSLFLKAIKCPNPSTTLSMLMLQLANNYHSFGESFIYFEVFDAGNNKGEIIPNSVYVSPPQITDIENIAYVPTGYVINGQTTKVVPLDRMIHTKNYNPDFRDMHGLPFIAVAGKFIDKLEAANETETKTYQNSGPSMLISPKEQDSFTDEQYLTFLQRLKRSWRKPENKRGIVGTSGQVEVTQLGMSPIDMGTIESQKNTMKSLLSLWGLDPGTFDTDASTYNNKLLIDQDIYKSVLIPYANNLIDQLNARFSDAYGEELMLDTSGIEALQPNYKDRAEWMTVSGVFTDNEIREAVAYDKRNSDISDMTPNERLEKDAVEGFSNESLNTSIVQ